MTNKKRKAYFVGGGIASLAGATYLLKDGGWTGKNIFILEEGKHFGGALDDNDISPSKFLSRGERMFTPEIYNCTLDLMSQIPLKRFSRKTLLDDFLAFNNDPQNKWHAKARLLEKGQIIDASKFGLSTSDELSLIKVLTTPEDKLEGLKINDIFEPAFFQTNFWFMVATTFAFQPWHSAIELRRYAYRFLHQLPKLHDMSCVAMTRYHQFDSLVDPTAKWLRRQGVNFLNNSLVTDLHFLKTETESTTNTTTEPATERVSQIHYRHQGEAREIAVGENDLVFFTNGSIITNASLGAMDKVPATITKKPTDSWSVWEKIAKDRPHFGRPEIFDNSYRDSKWESFSVTFTDDTFMNLMTDFTRSLPGTGGVTTIKDSNWLLSLHTPKQPHFKRQPKGVNVFWGYGLSSDQKGNFVPKKMSDCTGAEILTEICSHLGFTRDLPKILASADCTPCMMPYITSQFIERKNGDRPAVIPAHTKNFAFIGQFCEIPDEIVFTVEQSVRSALIAVTGLLNLSKPIPPIYHGQYDPHALTSLFGLCLDLGFKQLCSAVVKHKEEKGIK